MPMMKPLLLRQGDILLREIEDDDPDLVEAPKDARGLVLAEGETSHHFHAVLGRGAKLFRFRETGRIGAVLTTGRTACELAVIGGETAPGVPRHTPIKLPARKRFAVITQRAYTSEDEQRSRQVAD